MPGAWSSVSKPSSSGTAGHRHSLFWYAACIVLICQALFRSVHAAALVERDGTVLAGSDQPVSIDHDEECEEDDVHDGHELQTHSYGYGFGGWNPYPWHRPDKPDRPHHADKPDRPHDTHLRYMINFGDSYSDVGFRFKTDDMPTRHKPLGVHWPGRTSAGGINYIGLLTGEHNRSDIRTYDIARSGAVVSASALKLDKPIKFEKDFHAQVRMMRTFMDDVDWHKDDTLFTAWFGVNDITNVVRNTDSDEGLDRMIENDTEEYFQGFEELWDHGARKIILLTCPPFSRSPMILNQGPNHQRRIRQGIDKFNDELRRRANDFRDRHDLHDHSHRDDAFFAVYDTAPTFNEILDHPARYGAINARCSGGRPGAHCLWPTSLHPGQAVHHRLARSLADEFPGLFDKNED